MEDLNISSSCRRTTEPALARVPTPLLLLLLTALTSKAMNVLIKACVRPFCVQSLEPVHFALDPETGSSRSTLCFGDAMPASFRETPGTRACRKKTTSVWYRRLFSTSSFAIPTSDTALGSGSLRISPSEHGSCGSRWRGRAPRPSGKVMVNVRCRVDAQPGRAAIQHCLRA